MKTPKFLSLVAALLCSVSMVQAGITVEAVPTTSSNGSSIGSVSVPTTSSNGSSVGEVPTTAPSPVIGPSALKSADMLRQQGLATVTHGSRQAYSKSMNWDFPDSRHRVEATGNGAEDVLEKLFSQQLKYQLLNPNDIVESYCYLYDSRGNVIVYGYSEYSVNGKDIPEFRLWMQRIPVLSNIEAAEILAIDEDGKTARKIAMDVENGQVMFWESYAGAPNGILSVTDRNGQNQLIDLSSTTVTTPGVSSEGGRTWGIDNHNYVVVQKDIQQIKVISSYGKPTVTVKVVAAGTVEFDISGLVQDNGEVYIERPTALVIDGAPTNYNPAGIHTLQFTQPGVYRIWFQWKQFGQPGMLYTGPESTDGGKG